MNFNFNELFKSKKDPFYKPIKNLLKFQPKSLKYYKRAFTHRSLNKKDLNGVAINYERLEFLGDSILSSIISSYLFKNIPTGSEGYRTAEVTLGGVNTKELSSKTMMSLKHKNLFFIGEVVDVTGHLGGYNFQWAWSSGYVAGKYA